MLKAVVDEHGPSALRLKDTYVNDPKRMEQLLDTFPMSSVLKKVRQQQHAPPTPFVDALTYSKTEVSAFRVYTESRLPW